MEKLKKIPVIGYILRVLVALVKLPKHMDYLYKSIEDEQNACRELQRNIESINQFQHELQQNVESVNQSQNELNQKLTEMISRQSDVQNQVLEGIEKKGIEIEELRSWNADRMTEIRNLSQMYENLTQLHVDETYIKKLNLLLSINPTIWGSEERLHISPLATMSSCFFNTNSGKIFVGDYTFCGSGVSILAGSHDMNLTGLLRRDAEMTEGCDIVIGKGVWLASNCTILGPAKIGDNAVIAAGAVVVPGTDVPANTVYAGIPAQLIRNIEVCNASDIQNSAIINALERNGGILFAKGWTEKKVICSGEKQYVGHYLSDDEAVLFCEENTISLFYHFCGGDFCEIEIVVNEEIEITYNLQEKEGKFEVLTGNIPLGKTDKIIHKVQLKLKTKNIDFFVAIVSGEDSF